MVGPNRRSALARKAVLEVGGEGQMRDYAGQLTRLARTREESHFSMGVRHSSCRETTRGSGQGRVWFCKMVVVKGKAAQRLKAWTLELERLSLATH